MNQHRFLSVSLLLILAVGSLAYAAEEKGVISLQFVSFPKSSNSQQIELLIGEGKTIEVVMPTNSISPAYKVKSPGKWALGKTVAGENQETSFKVYGEASALAARKQIILVVRDGLADSDGLTLIPFDGESGGFTGGKYLFMNACKVDIAGEIGTTKFALGPRKHAIMSPKPSEVKGEREYLYTKLYFRKGEEAKPFYSSTWRFSEKARSMVFFYHDPHTGQLRLHTIRDYVE